MMDTFRRPRMAALSELCILGLLTAVLASGCGTSAPSAGSSQGGGEASGSASSAVETVGGADAW